MRVAIIDTDISNLVPDADNLRKQLYVIITNLSKREDAMAELNYIQFKKMHADMGTKLEKMQRKIEEFEQAQNYKV